MTSHSQPAFLMGNNSDLKISLGRSIPGDVRNFPVRSAPYNYLHANLWGTDEKLWVFVNCEYILRQTYVTYNWRKKPQRLNGLRISLVKLPLAIFKSTTSLVPKILAQSSNAKQFWISGLKVHCHLQEITRIQNEHALRLIVQFYTRTWSFFSP